MAVKPLSLVRWTALCAVAEAIGMTASASAAKASQALIGEPGSSREAMIALSIAVGGGLVEGIALGGLQAAGLGRMLPNLSRWRWLLVTTAVAGLGWAAATAAAGMSGQDDGATPAPLFVLGGSIALGVVMGGLLGAAQAIVLRGQVRHPWRWVGANMAAWAPAMAVIFVGATAPGADWPVATVVGLGAVTGLLAGTVLGLVSGWFLPSLDGPSAQNRALVSLLGSPAHRVLDMQLIALRVRGSVSGRTFELPVQYAADNSTVTVVPGRPETKRWWRNLAGPAPVDVLLGGHWEHGQGILLQQDEPGYDDAMDTYLERWPRARIPLGSPLVQVRLVDVIPAEARTPPTPPAAG